MDNLNVSTKRLARKVQLVPLTRKGVNTIRNAGTCIWRVIGQRRLVPLDAGPGWLLIVPDLLVGEWESDQRWVNIYNDTNFNVIDLGIVREVLDV